MNSEVPEFPPGQEQEPWGGCVGKWRWGRGTRSRAALTCAAAVGGGNLSFASTEEC